MHSGQCPGCRLQFETTLKKAIEFADSIDKNGPDRATDMQARHSPHGLCLSDVHSQQVTHFVP